MALILAIVSVAFDALLVAIIAALVGSAGSTGGLAAKIIFLIYMIRCGGAMKVMKRGGTEY